MNYDDVKQGMRVVVVYHEGSAGDDSQEYIGHYGHVIDSCKGAPDVRLDNGKVIVCDHREIEPLPIAGESTVLDTAIALVKTKAAELAAAEQALLALIREGK